MQQPALPDHVPGVIVVKIKIPGHIIHTDGLMGDGKAEAQYGYEQSTENQCPIPEQIAETVRFLGRRIHFLASLGNFYSV